MEVEDNLDVLDHHVWFSPYRKSQPTKRNKSTIDLFHVSRYSQTFDFLVVFLKNVSSFFICPFHIVNCLKFD